MENSSKVLLFTVVIAAIGFIISGFIGDGTEFSLNSRGAGQGILQLLIIFIAIIMAIISLIMHFSEKREMR